MEKLTLDLFYTQSFIRQEELTMLKPAVELAAKLLHERRGPALISWVGWICPNATTKKNSKE